MDWRAVIVGLVALVMIGGVFALLWRAERSKRIKAEEKVAEGKDLIGRLLDEKQVAGMTDSEVHDALVDEINGWNARDPAAPVPGKG